MNEMKDQLYRIMEERINQTRRSLEEEQEQPFQAEMREYTEHMDRNLRLLPREGSEWLDGQMMDRMMIPESQRLRYYKAGLKDALEVLWFLKG